MRRTVRILVDNNKSRVVGSRKAVNKLHNEFKLRAPGYFWSPLYRRRIWDGYTRYVTETGSFQTGLIDYVTDHLKKLKYKYTIEDERSAFKDLHIIDKVGDFELRGYQRESVVALLNNKFQGIKFIRGILNEATNAGKNLIAAAIMLSFSSKRWGLFLIDNSVIYDQAVKELEELMPGEIGHVRGKDIKWGRLTVCMVQSLSNLIKKDPKVKAIIAKIDIILVDECDSTMPKKVCKHILGYCYNAPIRVGLSGTPLMHKEKTRNLVVQMFFGPVVHTTTNKQLVEQGYSSKPHIFILLGNTSAKYKGDYAKEYRKGIIKNKGRNAMVWKKVAKAIKLDRSPVLILIKNHLHIKYLMQTCPAKIKNRHRIESVHHKTAGREAIFEAFKKEKITVLISSMIIRRGKNLPIMRTLINAAGGDSQANVLQILGRGLRRLEGKKDHLYLYDFWDLGAYIRRHSFHRLNAYKKTGFEVKEIYKNHTIK